MLANSNNLSKAILASFKGIDTKARLATLVRLFAPFITLILFFE